MAEEWKVLDLPSKSFDEFEVFFFDRTMVPDGQIFSHFHADADGRQYDDVAHSSPEVVVRHMTGLFSHFGEIAPRYSLAQVDQAIWGIFTSFSLDGLLFDTSLLLPDRLECVRSMYRVFADFVTQSKEGEWGGFWMWWDFILHDFWLPPRPRLPGTRRGDPEKLDAESRILLDAIFETLTRILELPDKHAQRSALHGLGHLHHPAVHETVQRYIDTHQSGFDLAWLEQCRDGNVL